MSCYTIAGINVEYAPKFEILEQRSIPYLSEPSANAEFAIETDIDKMEKMLPQYPLLDLPRLEYMIVGAEFYTALIKRKGLLLHASAVAVDGEAYAFSAPSGTGKSTHTSLWMEHFKDRGAFIINDDKPAIKLLDGNFYVYGTPFSGKCNLNANVCVPLKAVSFIERSQTNSIHRISPIAAVTAVLNQTIRPEDDAMLSELLDTIEKFAMQVNVYSLSCNVSEDAVKTAYSAMH